MCLWVYLSFLCVFVMLQVTNAKAVEKEFKALTAKLSEDGVAYKSLKAKVIERERIGKSWFIYFRFRYCFVILFWDGGCNFLFSQQWNS